MTEELPPLSAYADEPRANGAARDEERPVTLDDFYAYMPSHEFIFVPTRQFWKAASINARIAPVDVGAAKPVKPSDWLDQNRPVEVMTWSPGMPMVIPDQLVSGGGWFERAGARTFNLYQPPAVLTGDPSEAGPWIAHVRRVFPDEADHIITWLAQRVQRPGEKVNHALVLGGGQGVGKDSLLEPVRHAVGPWNFAEVSPTQLMGRFNGFVKSVILRVSEARDQGDAGAGRIDRYAVYEHTKTLTAAPPEVLRVDEKNLREYCVMNVCGLVFTTNHPDGIYLPPDDRRHFVAWSELAKEDFPPAYWKDLYHWYLEEGGIGHVGAYLASLDISAFDPKSPPPKTAGFHRMVDAGRAPEDAALADVLEALSNPHAATVSMLCTYAGDELREFLTGRKTARNVPHRMEAVGYVAVRNEGAKDGLWKVDGKRQVIYAQRELSIRDRSVAATRLCRGQQS